MVTKATEKIKSLGENWVWEGEGLTFAGIGSPSEHVMNLKTDFTRQWLVLSNNEEGQNDKIE